MQRLPQAGFVPLAVYRGNLAHGNDFVQPQSGADYLSWTVWYTVYQTILRNPDRSSDHLGLAGSIELPRRKIGHDEQPLTDARSDPGTALTNA